MNFYEKLYRLTTLRKLSQEELAEILSVLRQTIAKWRQARLILK